MLEVLGYKANITKHKGCISMVQTIKAYKCMKTTLKAYKSNIGTHHKSYISKGTNHRTTECKLV